MEVLQLVHAMLQAALNLDSHDLADAMGLDGPVTDYYSVGTSVTFEWQPLGLGDKHALFKLLYF